MMQDIGITAKTIIDRYCKPLTSTHVNTNTGIVAPIISWGRTPLSVFEDMRKEYGINFYVDYTWDVHLYFTDIIEESGYPEEGVIITLGDLERDPGSTVLHFLEMPRVNIEPPSANVVSVISHTASFTAKTGKLSEDEVIERLVEIKEGDYNVCRIVAEELLSRWSSEQKSVTGIIELFQGLDFLKKVRINIPEALIDEDMKVQSLAHDVINQTTTITVGDIILSDEELLARILDKL